MCAHLSSVLRVCLLPREVGPRLSPLQRRVLCIARELECLGTDRSLERSSALHLRPRKERTFRSDRPCLSPPVATQRRTQVCVRSRRSSAFHTSPQQPFHTNPTLGFIAFPVAKHDVEKKNVLDGRCIVSPGLKSNSPVRQGNGSRISRGTDPPRRGTQRRRQTVPTGPLPVSASMVPPWKSPRRVRLALSQGCRENQKRHLRSRRCQLLTAQRQATNPLCIVQNTRSLTTLAFISQHFGSGTSSSNPPMSAPAKTLEERSRRARSLRSLGAQHDRTRHHPRGPRRAFQSQRDNACSLAWAGTSRTPAFANAASCAALRNGTAAAATVMSIKHSAAHRFPATASLFHIAFLTILLSNLSTAQFLPKLSDLPLPQPRGMAAPRKPAH